MNKTQKGAWFGLATTLLCFAILGYVFIGIFIFEKLPGRFDWFLWWLVYLLLLGGAFIFLRRKQSPAEVNFDERDDLIKKRAAQVCFISVWILLITSYAILWHIVGLDGSIPLWILPFIYLGVFFAAGLVYNVAVLVQYGWRGKDGER